MSETLGALFTLALCGIAAKLYYTSIKVDAHRAEFERYLKQQEDENFNKVSDAANDNITSLKWRFELAKEKFQWAFTELIKDKKPLTFSDIYVGMSVIDSDGDVGVVTSMKDAHNIEVKGEYMTGLYCVAPNCIEYDGYVLYEYSK